MTIKIDVSSANFTANPFQMSPFKMSPPMGVRVLVLGRIALSGDRFLYSAGAGRNCALPMRLPNPSPVLDLGTHGSSNFIQCWGWGRGGRLLRHCQTPILYWMNFSLRFQALLILQTLLRPKLPKRNSREAPCRIASTAETKQQKTKNQPKVFRPKLFHGRPRGITLASDSRITIARFHPSQLGKIPPKNLVSVGFNCPWVSTDIPNFLPPSHSCGRP